MNNSMERAFLLGLERNSRWAVTSHSTHSGLQDDSEILHVPVILELQQVY